MATYRLYCLDAVGRISFADWIEAAGDAEAVAAARDMKNGALRCEVWQDHHLVARLDSDDLADSAS